MHGQDRQKNAPNAEADIGTILQHGGKSHRVGRGLLGAQETSVTFATASVEDPPVYARLGNTANHAEVEDLLAALHGPDSAALVCSSGMAALTTTLLTTLRPGDHLVVQKNCYGGTQQLIKHVLQPWGVEVDEGALEEWPSLMRQNTAACLMESISNPFCTPQNLEAAFRSAASVAGARRLKERGAVLICDNTFASPALCRPLAWGVDIVVESATKYLNGHSDVVAGLIASSPDVAKPLREVLRVNGGFLATASCVQLLRGLRTLALRIQKQSENGAAFAAAMRVNSGISRVWYGSEDPAIKRFFPAGWGGMVALELAEGVSPGAFLRALKIITDVPSLGGTESTVTSPWFTTHRWESEEQRVRQGITPRLMRFSIGLEQIGDVIADAEQALKIASQS